MKNLLSVLVCLLLLGCLTSPALAAPEEPRITLQPQNYHYPEYSVAVYTVKATGTNLHATWYLEYEGKTYNISDNQNGFEPWEAYAGENYGPMEEGPNTFSWFFGGIEADLSGAEIFCVLEDGHYDVTSQRAIITVQGDAMPPELLEIPASVSASRGADAEIHCIAKSGSDAQLSFQWYETATGKLQDIRAVDGEDCDFLICSTETPGTRYYVCCVTDTRGGMVYSSVVPVTVTDQAPVPQGKAPAFLTKQLPQGSVGEDYGFILETDDHGAVFNVYYNPGGANDFEKTGLKLSMEGMLAGKLEKAGTYTFTVCVSNDYGEDYATLTLTVVDPSETASTTTPETSPATTPGTTPETSPATTPGTAPETSPATTPGTTPETSPATTPGTSPESTPESASEETQPPESEYAGFPWWGYLLIVLGGVASGVGIAFIFFKAKKA